MSPTFQIACNEVLTCLTQDANHRLSSVSTLCTLPGWLSLSNWLSYLIVRVWHFLLVSSKPLFDLTLAPKCKISDAGNAIVVIVLHIDCCY